MSFPTTLLTLKIILISTGAISIAMAIKFSVPSIIVFTCYDLPMVWSSLLKWLKPPYLYFIINGIIITIAASSRFNHQFKDSGSHQKRATMVSVRTPPSSSSDVVAAVVLAQREAELNMNNVVQLPPAVEEVYEAEDQENEEAKVMKPVVVNGIQPEAVEDDDDDEEEEEEDEDEDEDEDDDDCMISEANLTSLQDIVPPETQPDLLWPVKEKPLLSSRFGHRKPIKTSPKGGRALRVARPQRLETLESTWKMITERNHVTLTRYLKNSDTWENHGRELIVNEFPPEHVPKSKTFRDRNNYDIPTTTMPLGRSSPIPGKVKKKPLLSRDELNHRVEAFIKKFYEEMRAQARVIEPSIWR